ncbi:cupredoxin domain-containing protein [Chitinibacter bivalviorum]|uniref:Cupredoxin domain-containing protein n=1 Tax=Chitinibacter bivalviorum TaxID=2739434 RepID=A0A7H9BLB0_9NEIS|nr:cupredoxin domain-containing protein [Chitinibacter bivalviorum]QLG89363.1 cupredoxin domain-containing protein [Chitinibacter bivalviorum]
MLRPTLAAVAALLFATVAHAEPVALTVTARATGFEPATLNAPAGQAIDLTVVNDTKAAIEFESKPLRQEKVIAPGKTLLIHLKPLAAGEYKFVNEYLEDKVRGVLIVK